VDAMPLEKVSQQRGLKIACSGFTLVLIAIAVELQLPPSGSSTSEIISMHLGESAFLVPSIVGSVLIFAGLVRIGVIARPVVVLIGGLALFLVASFLPLLSASFLPTFATRHSTVPFLMPLVVLRLLGLIFFSMGILRLLCAQRKKSDGLK
jgi:hypothetical protein